MADSEDEHAAADVGLDLVLRFSCAYATAVARHWTRGKNPIKSLFARDATTSTSAITSTSTSTTGADPLMYYARRAVPRQGMPRVLACTLSRPHEDNPNLPIWSLSPAPTDNPFEALRPPRRLCACVQLHAPALRAVHTERWQLVDLRLAQASTWTEALSLVNLVDDQDSHATTALVWVEAHRAVRSRLLAELAEAHDALRHAWFARLAVAYVWPWPG